jgi:CBS domain-containing protein
MLVRDLMQAEVATLNADDTLDLADDVMRLGRIRHLPVVRGDELVGVLSQRDLFRAAASSLLQLRRTAEQEWFGTIPVAAVMSTPAITVDPGLPIRVAVETMLDHRIGCLPVLAGGKLIGLLSETDCLRHLVHVLDIAGTRGALPELPP